MKTLVMNLREQLHSSLVSQEPICAWSMLVRPFEVLISMLEELRHLFMPYHTILLNFIQRILYLRKYSMCTLLFRSRATTL